MFRTTNGGTTWTPLWTYNGYPTVAKQFSMSVTTAPWLSGVGATSTTPPQPPFMMGWMMEGLSIDPFNSAHMMYGTGATLYATSNLTAWDTAGGVVNIASSAVGMEETSVGDLISPSSGTPHLISAVGDVGGWVHNNLDVAPTSSITVPCECGIGTIDYAENNPSDLVDAATGSTTATTPYTGSGFSTDGGNNWFHGGPDPVANSGGGTVAMASDASSVVWAGTTAPVSYTTTFGSSWSPSANIPAGSVVASDRVTPGTYYGLGGGKFWVSTDGGKTFTASAATGLPTSGNIRAVFGHAGDVWFTGSSYISGGGTQCNGACGLWHTTNGGTTITQISTVSSAAVIGFGLGPTAGTYSVFMFGVPTGGIDTIYRSDDEGATWVQITDSQHMFATIQTITGDPRIYGRVYFGTNGLGIFYGDIAGSTATNTPGASPTNTPVTPTSTPSKTNTPTNTPTTGPTKTSTPTNTPVTPTKTSTFTPTFVVSATNTPSKTNTPTTGPSLTPSKTNTPTNTAVVTNTPSKTNTPAITATTGSSTLNVKIMSGGTDSTQQSQFNFLVTNSGSSAVSNITVRVYFTTGTEGASSYVLEKYWDQSGIATISGPTAAASGGTNYYFTISFGTTALAAGASWQFNTAIHLSDWSSNLTPASYFYHTGYALAALPSSMTSTNYIPAYVSGTQVWGATTP